MMKDAQIFNFVLPIIESEFVNKVHIVRKTSNEPLSSPKVQYHKIDGSNKFFSLVSYYKVCRDLNLSGQIDAWISFYNIPYGLIAYLSTKETRIPYHIGFVGSDWYNSTRRNLLNSIYPNQIKGSGFITVTGKEMKQQVIDIGANSDSVEILPHSINNNLFALPSHKSKEYEIIFVGQLIDRKRPETLIKILEYLNKLGTSPKICVVGDGEKMNYLLNLAKEKGLEEQLIFKGFVNYEDYVKLLHKSRIFFLPSTMEGLPFALVEAMSAGLVPVCSNVGTIDDLLIHGENGFLYHPNDLKGFTKILFKLINNKSYFDSIASNVKKSSKNFRYSESTKLWNKWFKRIIQYGAKK